MSQGMEAVVTGATSGIGEAIARRLAADGATVTVVGRDAERLERTLARIERAVPAARLRPELADLSLMEDVRALAERLARRPSLDAVISNAAVIAPVDAVTSEGLRRVVAVNHLAPYLLLRLLGDHIGDRHAARFVMVAADPRRLADRPVDVDDVAMSRADTWPIAALRPFAAYGLTKNMNTMVAYALARRLRGTAITVNAAHPGIVAGTRLGGEMDDSAIQQFHDDVDFDPAELIDVDAGADTPAWLATATEPKGVSGAFFVKRAKVTTAPHTTDRHRCDRLWDASARLVGLD